MRSGIEHGGMIAARASDPSVLCSARGCDSRVLGLLLFSLPPFPTLDVRDSFAVVCGMCVRRTCAPNIYHPFIEQRA